MPKPRIELGAALQQHDVLPVGYVATLMGYIATLNVGYVTTLVGYVTTLNPYVVSFTVVTPLT